MKIFRLLAVGVALCCGGCGLFWNDPYFNVTAAPLNWLEIHYYNARHDPVLRESVRLTGDGFVEVRSGTSRRVADSFAKTFNDSNWEDIRTLRLHVDPEVIRQTLQDLVNAGFFDEDRLLTSTRNPSHGRFIAARASIEGQFFSDPRNIFDSDPEIAERLFNIVRQYKPTTIGRKRVGALIGQPKNEVSE